MAGGTADSPAYLVRYEPKRVRAQWFHIRAFVLAYTNIALRKILRRFDPTKVTRICTDAIYATEFPQSVFALLSTDEKTIKWGQWRFKPAGYTWYEMREAAQLTGSLPELEQAPSDAPPIACDPHNISGVTASAVPKELTAAVLAGHSKILITGQGGCGKTYVIAKALEGRNFAILCPSNDLAESHRRTLKCRAETYHKVLGLPVGKSIDTWKPEDMGHKLDNIPEILVCDEGSMIPKPIWERILPYLESRGRQVIICEDDAQLSDFEKSRPAEYHKEWATTPGGIHIEFTVDMPQPAYCHSGPRPSMSIAESGTHSMWPRIVGRAVCAGDLDEAIAGLLPVLVLHRVVGGEPDRSKLVRAASAVFGQEAALDLRAHVVGGAEEEVVGVPLGHRRV